MLSKNEINSYKRNYPKGTRIQVDRMCDDPNPISKGVKGTVLVVDDLGTIHCKFDNGRSLGLCPEVDSFHKINEKVSEG